MYIIVQKYTIKFKFYWIFQPLFSSFKVIITKGLNLNSITLVYASWNPYLLATTKYFPIGILTIKNAEYLDTGQPIEFIVKVYRTECNAIEETIIISVYILGVSITNNEWDGLVNLYPNPTNDLLTIQTEQPGQNSIEITSLNGQLIFSSEMEGNSHQIDLTPFRSGIYFITVRSRDFVTTRKVIKLWPQEAPGSRWGFLLSR